MIEPVKSDIGMPVIYRPEDGVAELGTVTGFDDDWVYVQLPAKLIKRDRLHWVPAGNDDFFIHGDR